MENSVFGLSIKAIIVSLATGAGAILLVVSVPDETLVRKFLVIHTDDAGMCHSMNLATIDSLEQGLVTSASIMAPCPGFDEFAKWAVDHPEYDYGIHLTLTNETRRFGWGPVLPTSEVPTLVDGKGNFWRTSTRVAKNASLAEVKKELKAQIDKVLDAGIRVTHLDNHMYSLLGREDLINLYVELGLEYDLPIRYRDVETMPLKQRAEFSGGLINVYTKGGDKLKKNGMPLFAFAESDNYDAPPDEKRNHFIKAVRSLPPGVSEFVIHCGYKDVEGPEPPYVSGRAEDARVFQSPEMRRELSRHGIELLNWKQFREIEQQF